MMSEKSFITEYATKVGVNKTEAKKQVDAFLVTLMESVARQDGVQFRGIFTAKKFYRKGREGNVAGHEYKTEGKNTVKFTVGKEFEDALN